MDSEKLEGERLTGETRAEREAHRDRGNGACSPIRNTNPRAGASYLHAPL
jgi:hypothetical protein